MMGWETDTEYTDAEDGQDLAELQEEAIDIARDIDDAEELHSDEDPTTNGEGL